MKKFKISFLLLLIINISSYTQSLVNTFYFNQLGFYKNGPKEIVWAGSQEKSFAIVEKNSNKVVFNGVLSEQRINPFSNKTTQIAHFSSYNKVGQYVIKVGNFKSQPFGIQQNELNSAAKASLKSYYFQRASMPLEIKFAGQYARPAGHADNEVYIHPSAATAQRPAESIINSSRGWYDAGDYNKYIINSGISMGTLFLLYENFPDFCKKIEVNIPESSNAIPDLLDEALYNLRWMLTMQDPADGGVYHKCTNAEFDKMNVMPHQVSTKRYVIYKTTTAALDFCAVMAQASRVYRQYAKELPGLSDSCLVAAKTAWLWAKNNPNIIPNQNELNKKFEPKINTGSYDDSDASDEWAWAAAEMYATTGNEQYYPANLFPAQKPNVQVWRSLHRMAYYTFLNQEKSLGPKGKADLPKVKSEIVEFANNLLQGVDKQSFNTVMGRNASDFMWGSTGHAANQGLALIQAFIITKDKKYLTAALGNLDYLYGRNATGYSFLTGFGHKQVMHLHHRPSEADKIEAPIPGLLSGGTNPKRQDKCQGYTTTIVDEHFLDDVCSYSTNENCINWNAAMVYLSWSIEALQSNFK